MQVVRFIFDEADNTHNALKAWGIESPTIAPEVYVWECNVKILELFIACHNQLRTTMGGVIGLDYTAVKIVADALNIDFNAQTLYGIKSAEEEFLKILNKDKK